LLLLCFSFCVFMLAANWRNKFDYYLVFGGEIVERLESSNPLLAFRATKRICANR